MKKQLALILSTVLFLFTIAACTQAPKADKAEVKEAQEVPKAAEKSPTDTNADADAASAATGNALSVNTEASKLTWIGTKPVGQHNGTIKLKEGKIQVDGDNITGGSFTFDMNSLDALDSSDDMNAKLAGHLKSPDFFDTEKFPEGKFEITEVKKYEAEGDSEKPMLDGSTHTIAGNLTLKGVTKNITFPAIVNMNGGMMKAKASFNINRTDWGLSYGNDESLGDKFIRPTVNVGFDIETK